MLFAIGFINGAVLAAITVYVICSRPMQFKKDNGKPSEKELEEYNRRLQQIENFFNYNGSEAGQVDV